MADSSVFSRLFRLIFFVGLIVVAYTYGWPLLEQKFGRRSDPAFRCIQDLSALTDRFGSEMRHYEDRRADVQAWLELKEDLRFDLTQAKTTCRCELPSCAKGRAAWNELDQLISRFDNAMGGGSLVSDPQGHLNRIDSLLAEGRHLVDRGQ